MLKKEELLSSLVAAFTYIERFDIKEIREMNRYKLKLTRSHLRSIIYELIGFEQFISYLQLNPARYIVVDVEKDGEKFLFKPYKIKDIANPDFPIAVFFKPFLDMVILLCKKIEQLGFELEIKRWFWPSVRDERLGARYKLLHKHAWGKAVDVLIKGWSAGSTFHFFEKHLADFQPGFFVIELNESVHLHMVKGKSIFHSIGKSQRVSCENIANPSLLQSK